jgi:hypothetical protein
MEEKKKKKKAKLKLFGKKKSKKEDYHLPAPPAAYPQYQQTLTPHPDDKKKKKSGFKSKIKGLVRGRSKRNAKTGKDENSLYDEDYDPHNPPQQFMSGPPPRRNDGRNPELLAGIDYSDSSSGDSEFHQSLKPVREVDEDDYLSDEDIKDTSGQNFVHRAATSRRRNRLGPDSSDDNIEVMGKSGRDFLEIDELDEPVTLVTLLLDPDTLRFELLQLELDDPKDLKVQDVLDQLEESITESALQPLKFIALMDRKGGVHTADIVMIKAMAQRRDRNKDILVGYSKNSSVEEIFKRARPILGDPNVGRMVRTVRVADFQNHGCLRCLFDLTILLYTLIVVGNERLWY